MWKTYGTKGDAYPACNVCEGALTSNEWWHNGDDMMLHRKCGLSLPRELQPRHVIVVHNGEREMFRSPAMLKTNAEEMLEALLEINAVVEHPKQITIIEVAYA